MIPFVCTMASAKEAQTYAWLIFAANEYGMLCPNRLSKQDKALCAMALGHADEDDGCNEPEVEGGRLVVYLFGKKYTT